MCPKCLYSAVIFNLKLTYSKACFLLSFPRSLVQNKNLTVLSIDTMSVHLIRSLISVCNVLFYQETWRQKNKIKARQLPQQEVERFAKESKALKTTVHVVRAVVLWFQWLTSVPFISSAATDKCEKTSLHHVLLPLIRTCGFLSNSLSLFVPQQGSLRKNIVGDTRITCPRQVRLSLHGEVETVHRLIYEWKLSCFLNTSLFVILSSQVGGKINNITGNWLSMISVHVSQLPF